jgi:hypothetical protein
LDKLDNPSVEDLKKKSQEGLSAVSAANNSSERLSKTSEKSQVYGTSNGNVSSSELLTSQMASVHINDSKEKLSNKEKSPESVSASVEKTASPSLNGLANISKSSINELVRSKSSLNELSSSKHSLNELEGNEAAAAELTRSKSSINEISGSKQSLNDLLASKHSVNEVSGSKHSLNELSGSKHSLNGVSGSKHSLNEVSGSKHSLNEVSGSKHSLNEATVSKSSLKESTNGSKSSLPAEKSAENLVPVSLNDHTEEVESNKVESVGQGNQIQSEELEKSTTAAVVQEDEEEVKKSCMAQRFAKCRCVIS